MFFCVSTGTYALSFGLPTTINQLGYTAANAQLLTIPVYFFACVCCIINALSADRLRLRSPFIIIPYISGVIGTIICLTVSPVEKPGVIYFAMFLVAAALFPNTPCIVAWISNNLAGQWKRATGMALEFTIGNLVGGVIGSNIFLERQKPTYSIGYDIEITFMVLGIVIALTQVFTLKRANGIKAEQVKKAEEEGRDLDAEYKDLGDKNPTFRYTL